MKSKTVTNEDCCSSPAPLTLDDAAASLVTAKRLLNDAEEEFEACAYRLGQAYARRERAKIACDGARGALLTIRKG